MKNDSSKNIKTFVFASLFCAVICVSTMFIQIRPGLGNGYYHIGDSFIYLAAVLLPLPYAMAAASVGAALADLLTGNAIYIIPTLLIKAAITLFFTQKKRDIPVKIINMRRIPAVIFAGCVTVFGYYIAEVILFTHNFASALPTIPGNLLQASVSAVVFFIVGLLFDRLQPLTHFGDRF